MEKELADVLICHMKFHLPIGMGGPRFFSPNNLQKRVDFIQEEFDEFKEAIAGRDLEKAVDALIDMTYVIKGTAVMFGISPQCWDDLWTEVHSANMQKEASGVDDYHFGLKKPAGWVPPRIGMVLKKHGADI